MTYQLSLCTFLFVAIHGWCQQEEVLLKGQILEFENSIAGAHVYNTNTFQGTSSTDQGNFAIKVRLNDTLIISHVNYFTVKIAVDKKVLIQYPFIIYMKEKTNQLETVNIKNHDLTKNLKVDSKNRPRIINNDSIIADFQYIVKEQIKKSRTTIIDGKHPIFISPDILGNPILHGSIGFKFKDLELKRELKAKREFPKKLIDDLGIYYFTETLKIPKDKVYHFITYCEERNIMELYKKNELMKILTILDEESKEYLELKEFNSMD